MSWTEMVSAPAFDAMSTSGNSLMNVVPTPSWLSTLMKPAF